MENQFLTKKEKKQISENINLSKLSNSDIEFIYDLYITKYPTYKAFDAQLIADIINADLCTSITSRNIEVIRDISLQEEILDNKLLMSNLGYSNYTQINEEEYE